MGERGAPFSFPPSSPSPPLSPAYLSTTRRGVEELTREPSSPQLPPPAPVLHGCPAAAVCPFDGGAISSGRTRVQHPATRARRRWIRLSHLPLLPAPPPPRLSRGGRSEGSGGGNGNGSGCVERPRRQRYPQRPRWDCVLAAPSRPPTSAVEKATSPRQQGTGRGAGGRHSSRWWGKHSERRRGKGRKGAGPLLPPRPPPLLLPPPLAACEKEGDGGVRTHLPAGGSIAVRGVVPAGAAPGAEKDMAPVAEQNMAPSLSGAGGGEGGGKAGLFVPRKSRSKTHGTWRTGEESTLL